MTLKQGLKLSAIIDKLDLQIKNPSAKAEEIGADLIMQIIKKLHKAENEIYAFVAEIKGIKIEEAQQIDLVEFIKELTGNSEVLNFFKFALK